MPKYSVTKDINSETRTNNFMSPGIHENVELKNLEEGKYPIVYGESTQGSKFAAIHFVNDKGEVLIHTEYEPSDDNQEKLDSKTVNQIKRFKHIITKFVPEGNFLFESDNFEDFVKKCIQILGDNYKGIKVRLKVTLNNKNYTSLPKYIPFIELMSIEKSKSKLSINSIMDKMIRDKADVETPSNTNPFAEETIQVTQNSDNYMNVISSDIPF
jgi:hypothetical protein